MFSINGGVDGGERGPQTSRRVDILIGLLAFNAIKLSFLIHKTCVFVPRFRCWEPCGSVSGWQTNKPFSECSLYEACDCGVRGGRVPNGSGRLGCAGQWEDGDHAAGAWRRVLFTCSWCDGEVGVTSPARPRMTSARGAGATRSPAPRRAQSMPLVHHLATILTVAVQRPALDIRYFRRLAQLHVLESLLLYYNSVQLCYPFW